MNLFDTWIIVTPSTWSAIIGSESIDEYTYQNARTGFWKSAPGGREVYNVIGSQEQISDIISALEAESPGSVLASYSWVQGNGLDSPDPWPTDPDGVLSLMRDHITYDDVGNVISTVPATLESPNWGHIFLGQSERVFAGEFSTEFSEEFF